LLLSLLYAYVIGSIFGGKSSLKNRSVANKKEDAGAVQIDGSRKVVNSSIFILGIAYGPFAVFILIINKYFKSFAFNFEDWQFYINLAFLSLAVIFLRKLRLTRADQIIYTLSALYFLGLIMSAKATHEANKMRQHINHNYANVYMINKNKVVKTNDSLIMIGQTSNYLFLYNRIDSVTSVYDVSKLEDLSFK
jgi:hypothetical protein